MASSWPTVKSWSYSLSECGFITLLELTLLLLDISTSASLRFLIYWFVVLLSPIELWLLLLPCSLTKCRLRILIALVHVILVKGTFLLVLLLLYGFFLASKDRELTLSSRWSLYLYWGMYFRRSLVVLLWLSFITKLLKVLINNLWWCTSISNILIWNLTVITIIRLFWIGWLKLIWIFLLVLLSCVIIPTDAPLSVTTYKFSLISSLSYLGHCGSWR